MHMCGFVGVFNPKTLTPSDLNWISESLLAIEHRGPDDSGMWESLDRCSSLGHQRLSVIDLSSGGHQPMHSLDGQLHLSFNGEIYNYLEIRDELEFKGFQFVTESDTEVLLNAYSAWGDNCVDHLNGQFSFAIIDDVNEKLFLARDRAGEKPLYFAQLPTGLILFGSELKALALHPHISLKIASSDLESFLTRGYVDSERSILESIRKLLPAHSANINLTNQKLETTHYWKPKSQKNSIISNDFQTLSLKLEELLSQAIERQFVSDVPVGVLLSGGLDSSIITALASQTKGRIQTFTAAFGDSSELNEAKYAKLIADAFDTEHHEYEISKPSLDVIEFLGTNFDEPIFDPSIIPTYLLSKEIRKHCTVALGGDGADELFGGYKHYSRAVQTREIQSVLPFGLRKLVAMVGTRLVPYGKPGHARFIQLLQDDYFLDPQKERMFDLAAARKLLGLPIGTHRIKLRDTMSPRSSKDIVQSLCMLDFNNYLPNDILVKIDRCSMLNSLEMRSPFLDEDVMSFAHNQVPGNLKATANKRKILLASVGRRILPNEFDFKRKLGFVPPTIKWGLTQEWQEFMQGYLLSSRQVIFDKSVLREYFGKLKDQPLLVDRLLTLTLFEIWRQKNICD